MVELMVDEWADEKVYRMVVMRVDEKVEKMVDLKVEVMVV